MGPGVYVSAKGINSLQELGFLHVCSMLSNCLSIEINTASRLESASYLVKFVKTYCWSSSSNPNEMSTEGDISSCRDILLPCVMSSASASDKASHTAAWVMAIQNTNQPLEIGSGLELYLLVVALPSNGFGSEWSASHASISFFHSVSLSLASEASKSARSWTHSCTSDNEVLYFRRSIKPERQG